MPSRSRSSAWRADSVVLSCVTPVPAPAGSAENMRNRAPTLSRAVLPGEMRAIRKRVRLSTSVRGLHPTPMTPSASHSPPAGAALDWLQCIGQSDEAIRGFKLNMLLYELLSLLYSRFVSGVRRPELVRSGRNITMQIIGYMTSHRKQHLEATDVAREFGYGREHFCRLFRKATGKTFKEFLTDLRLDDACRKLSGSSASIASIARECGFPDTRALQTAVQRKYGIRAQEYRERYENRN